MRLIPISSAAPEKLSNYRVTPGRASQPTVNVTSSVPKKRGSTAKAAPLNVLWPEGYSGWGGVVRSGSLASHPPSALHFRADSQY
jgi:hypothetical protein